MLLAIPTTLGYPALGGLILGESAGLPLPGETALITAGGMAGAGDLSLPLVILIAAIAAIVGDSIGYALGRRRGRDFLLRDGFLASHRRRAVARADRFFIRRGAATVFFARWIPGVRIVAAVLAGAAQMPWKRFALANALGAVAWATAVASLAALLGPTVSAMIAASGIILALAAAAIAWGTARRNRPRAGVADANALG